MTDATVQDVQLDALPYIDVEGDDDLKRQVNDLIEGEMKR